MKKTVITFTAIVMMGTIFTSCSSPSEKVETAEKNALEANQNLINEKQDFMKEMETYKKNTAEKIAENEKSIAEFKARIAKQKGATKAAYQKEMEALNNKNSDMKKKLADFKTDTKSNWEFFKTEFGHDMEELGTALKGFGVKSEK